MPCLTVCTRKRVIIWHRLGYLISDIKRKLEEENVCVSSRSLQRLIKKFRCHHTIRDLPRRAKPRKLSEDMTTLMDNMLKDNDEMTARQTRSRLVEEFEGLKVSLSTVKRARKAKGWVCTRPHYCQLIREVNKVKRKDWCQQQIDTKEKFDNVIFTDECTVKLDHHGRLCFRKELQPRKLKQRPKHLCKIHIWGGISVRGATRIIMFTGIMDVPKYVKILEIGLVPFITKCFPEGHRLQQDNDPKHTSNYVKRFFEAKNINWWKTPPENPNLNPIENVWGSLKQFLRSTYKPSNVEELKAGIQEFWASLTPSVCSKYIGHLHKVMPKVVEVDGNPSGY